MEQSAGEFGQQIRQPIDQGVATEFNVDLPDAPDMERLQDDFQFFRIQNHVNIDFDIVDVGSDAASWTKVHYFGAVIVINIEDV